VAAVRFETPPNAEIDALDAWLLADHLQQQARTIAGRLAATKIRAQASLPEASASPLQLLPTELLAVQDALEALPAAYRTRPLTQLESALRSWHDAEREQG
jgi:hypothetical protein